jgi:hypothetical protein
MRLWLLLRDMLPVPSWKWEKRVRLDFYSRTRVWRKLCLEAQQGKEDAQKIRTISLLADEERRTSLIQSGVNVLRPRSR